MQVETLNQNNLDKIKRFTSIGNNYIDLIVLGFLI